MISVTFAGVIASISMLGMSLCPLNASIGFMKPFGSSRVHFAAQSGKFCVPDSF